MGGAIAVASLHALDFFDQGLMLHEKDVLN